MIQWNIAHIMNLVVCHEFNGGVRKDSQQRSRVPSEETSDAIVEIYVTSSLVCTRERSCSDIEHL